MTGAVGIYEEIGVFCNAEGGSTAVILVGSSFDAEIAGSFVDSLDMMLVSRPFLV